MPETVVVTVDAIAALDLKKDGYNHILIFERNIARNKYPGV